MTLPKSKFKGVYPIILNGKYVCYMAQLMHKYVYKKKCCKSEREAALCYDRFCIEFGLPPINILKPKK